MILTVFKRPEFYQLAEQYTENWKCPVAASHTETHMWNRTSQFPELKHDMFSLWIKFRRYLTATTYDADWSLIGKVGYCIVLYLEIYIAPLTVHTNQALPMRDTQRKKRC